MKVVVHGEIGAGKSTAVRAAMDLLGWPRPAGFFTHWNGQARGAEELWLETWTGERCVLAQEELNRGVSDPQRRAALQAEIERGQQARDQLIQAMGMLFTVSTVALGLSLGQASLLGRGEVILSAGAALPAVVGMIAGQAVRLHLSEQRFRTVFFTALLALGLYIAIHALTAR